MFHRRYTFSNFVWHRDRWQIYFWGVQINVPSLILYTVHIHLPVEYTIRKISAAWYMHSGLSTSDTNHLSGCWVFAHRCWEDESWWNWPDQNKLTTRVFPREFSAPPALGGTKRGGYGFTPWMSRVMMSFQKIRTKKGTMALDGCFCCLVSQLGRWGPAGTAQEKLMGCFDRSVERSLQGKERLGEPRNGMVVVVFFQSHDYRRKGF